MYVSSNFGESSKKRPFYGQTDYKGSAGPYISGCGYENGLLYVVVDVKSTLDAAVVDSSV